jgi:hypothetical protein
MACCASISVGLHAHKSACGYICARVHRWIYWCNGSPVGICLQAHLSEPAWFEMSCAPTTTHQGYVIQYSERRHFRDESLERYHMCENHIAISQPSASAIGPAHKTPPHFVNRIYCFRVLCQLANAPDRHPPIRKTICSSVCPVRNANSETST